MRFTLDHEDRVRYRLTEDTLIPDAVFMVTSRPYQKYIVALLNCQELYIKIETFMSNSKDKPCLV